MGKKGREKKTAARKFFRGGETLCPESEKRLAFPAGLYYNKVVLCKLERFLVGEMGQNIVFAPYVTRPRRSSVFLCSLPVVRR